MDQGLWTLSAKVVIFLCSLISGVCGACSGEEIQSLAANNGFSVTVSPDPSDVCNTLDYSQKDLLKLTLGGEDVIEALLGSIEGSLQTVSGKAVVIKKDSSVLFGIGTVVTLTVDGATSVILTTPEDQQVDIAGGVETEVSFTINTEGIIKIKFLGESGTSNITYGDIAIEDCQDGNVTAALSGVDTALMMQNNEQTTIALTDSEGRSFNMDTKPILYVLGVETVTFQTIDGTEGVVTTDSKTVAAIDEWKKVDFADGSLVEDVEEVQLVFTYASSSLMYPS